MSADSEALRVDRGALAHIEYTTIQPKSPSVAARPLVSLEANGAAGPPPHCWLAAYPECADFSQLARLAFRD